MFAALSLGDLSKSRMLLGVCVEGATAEGDYIEGEDFLVCESASNCPTGLEESSAEYSDEDSDSNYDSDTFEYERKSFDESYWITERKNCK